MKRILILLFVFGLTSCGNNNGREKENSGSTETTITKPESRSTTSESSSPQGTSEKEPSSDTTPGTTSAQPRNPPVISGNYIKKEETSDVNCSCYCLKIQYTSSEKLCISPNKIYVNVQFKKTKTDTINVYYSGVAPNSTDGKDIPWDKFDTNVPVALIVPADGDEISLNWLGFTINGDLAIDYAIYGKKTLEGKYKKQ
ncbi:MAG: hypothetical protein WCD31_12040 [Gillisia sp.]